MHIDMNKPVHKIMLHYTKFIWPERSCYTYLDSRSLCSMRRLWWLFSMLSLYSSSFVRVTLISASSFSRCSTFSLSCWRSALNASLEIGNTKNGDLTSFQLSNQKQDMVNVNINLLTFSTPHKSCNRVTYLFTCTTLSHLCKEPSCRVCCSAWSETGRELRVRRQLICYKPLLRNTLRSMNMAL